MCRIMIFLGYESQGKTKSNFASKAGALFDWAGFCDHVSRSSPAVLVDEPRGIRESLTAGGGSDPGGQESDNAFHHEFKAFKGRPPAEGIFFRRPPATKNLYSFFTNPQSMRVLTQSNARTQPSPSAASVAVPDGFFANVLAAIQRSQDYLLSVQKPEGYWVGELMVDSTLVSDMLAFHHWDGSVDKEWERKAINHLFERQQPDGGWNIYHGGPAEVNATIKAYLALKLAGVSVTDPRMLRAREVAIHLGGVPRMNTFSKLNLALIGLFPWEYVPTIPSEVLFLGKWFHVNFWDMSNW